MASTIYTTGTISFTNNSANIVGVGTTFTDMIEGDPIQGPDGKWYELATIASNTAATLDRNYAGATANNQVGGTNWVIFKTAKARDSVRTATKQLTDISNLYRQTINYTSVDQTLKLSKAAAGNNAGQVLQKAGVDLWQMGTFGDDDWSVQFKLASVWTKAFAVNSTTGSVSINQALLLGSAITPATLAATTNDYAPTGFATANMVRVSGNAARDLTGLSGGTAGRIVMLVNVGNFDLTLKKEAAGSAAANRFAMALDIIMASGQNCILIYDATAARWRPMAGGGAGPMSLGTVATGAAGTNVIITNTGSAIAPIWNFTIPRGDAGINGTAATIAVGTVTTGAAGSSASVSNAGNSTAAQFNFTIPRGDTGAIGPGYAGSSATSDAIALGATTLAVQAGLAFLPGQRVRIASTANGANYMEGFVTSYSAGSLIVNVVKIGGSGTFASWSIGIAGEPGTGDLLSANNLSDLGNAATARTNLGLSTMATAVFGTGSGQVAQGNDSRITNAAQRSGANTFNNGHQIFPLVTVTDAASVAWNVASAQKGKLTLAGNRTMAVVSGIVEGATYFLWVVQDATGSRTLTWTTAGAGGFDFGAAGAPTLSTAANSADLLCFEAITIGGTLKMRYMGIQKGFT